MRLRVGRESVVKREHGGRMTLEDPDWEATLVICESINSTKKREATSIVATS